MTKTQPNWADVRVSDVVDSIEYGYTAKAIEGTGPRLLRITDIQNGRVDWNRVPSCEVTDENLGRYELKQGDIVFARTGATTGKSYLIRDCPSESVFASYLIRLRPSPTLLPAYMAFFFQSNGYWRQIAEQATGTAQPGVNSTRLRELQLPLAPLPEQHRIVSAIESYFTRLDDAAATLERVQRNLKRYRASVLKAAVEGRLVPTEAELARAEDRDYEPASVLLERILAERRRRWEEVELAKFKAKGKTPKDDRWKGTYKAPVAPDTSGLPELSEGWCWATASQVSKDKPAAICAGPFGTIFKAKDFRSTGVPIIQLRHVKPDRFLSHKQTYMAQEKWEELFRDDYSVFGGEILIAKLGDPPGDCAVFPESRAPSMLTPDVMKLEVDEQVATPRYIMHYINSIAAKQYTFGSAFGTTRLRLTLPLFRAMPIPVPPIREQVRITELVDRLLTVADDVDEGVRRDERWCNRLRQAVLKWAFEGRLVDQDPTDEPASALLERIRAERASASDKPPRHPRRTKLRPPKS